jgi:4-hydroxy-3-polyprenylbenzoate decarboxylase
LIVGITGASGAIFGVRVLERLNDLDIETHLIITPWGSRTLEHETHYSARDVGQLADVVHKPSDQSSLLSSGSFHNSGMVIAPCSMKTLASIANGWAGDLISRTADVTLKEQRRLILLVRETPLSAVHLENMLKLARVGVGIVPPVPAFYNYPTSLEDIVDHIVTRTLDQLGVRSESNSRWNGRLGAPAEGCGGESERGTGEVL